MTLADDSSTAVTLASADSSPWPPGFRFHPTDEELVLYYLKRKICKRRLQLNIISELDVYKWDPEGLPGQSLQKTGDRQWFFFSQRDRKYPNAARSNRATRQGYWKATGKDRIIISCGRAVGVKKTLVFYKGRAPNGERTDWVMHEYTMDEEELKRCQNAQEYYALYKLYKKSGSGPKNGEQYGAPFREEEWADDDCFDSVKAADLAVPVEKPAVVISNVKAVNASQLYPPLDDIQEFFNELAELPDLDEVLGNDTGFMPWQVGLEDEEQLQSTLMDPPPLPGELIISEPPYCFHTDAAHYDVPPVIDDYQLGCSKLQLPEKSAITNAAENCNLDTRRNEDFLEIDDLDFGTHGSLNMENTGKQAEIDDLDFGIHGSLNMENTGKQANFEDSDGFGDIDLFQDAAMFLCDIGSLDQGNFTLSHVHFFSNSLMNQDYYGLQPPHFDDVDQSCSQLWDHEQRLKHYASIECVEGVQHLPSGAISDTTNLLNESSQVQGKDGSGAVSRLSSALWSFVDSIPSDPASASESMLVHRAFGRMSSFSRVRLDSVALNSRGGNACAVVKTAGSRHFHFLYVVGSLVALCGVFIGSLKLWVICAW